MPKLNIYIVEDDSLMAGVLIKLLGDMGHAVIGVATTYEKAISEIQKTEIDLVITDIMLASEKTGIDVGDYIKRYLDIPFIYLSSATESATIKAALATQPLSYLVKPMNKASLKKAIFNLYAQNGPEKLL